MQDKARPRPPPVSHTPEPRPKLFTAAVGCRPQIWIDILTAADAAKNKLIDIAMPPGNIWPAAHSRTFTPHECPQQKQRVVGGLTSA